LSNIKRLKDFVRRLVTICNRPSFEGVTLFVTHRQLCRGICKSEHFLISFFFSERKLFGYRLTSKLARLVVDIFMIVFLSLFVFY